MTFEEQPAGSGPPLPPVANRDTPPTAIVPVRRLFMCADLPGSEYLFVCALKDHFLKFSGHYW